MQKGVLVAVLGVLAVLVVAGVIALRPKDRAGAPLSGTPTSAPRSPEGSGGGEEPTPAGSLGTFGTPKKSAHFESSTPEHGAMLAAVPLNVVIDFNFDLAAKSSLSITSGGKEYGTGTTVIDANRLAMRRTVDPAAPDGLYTVTYQACWPDGTCHDGSFQFAIDRSQATSSLDATGQKTVNVRLKDIAFSPMDVRISRGAEIVWTNNDTVEHYVNTDAHPSHTYYPAQNSRVLKTGDTYSLAFTTPGAYPYHCSAHADTMRGVILVE